MEVRKKIQLPEVVEMLQLNASKISKLNKFKNNIYGKENVNVCFNVMMDN